MAVTGIGLMSGGLDSMLAARLLMEQGIEVVGISFTTPFFGSANAEKASKAIGFPLLIRDITSVHLEVVKDPPTGYGANMNPCIDCHALMVKEARKIMDEKGYDFIFTGEVLNERPMSQTRPSLNRVANLAGLATNFFFGMLRASLMVALYNARAQVSGISLQQAITFTGLS